MSEICYYQKLCSAHSFVLEMRVLLSEDIKRLEQPDRRWTRKQGQETHLHSVMLRLNFLVFFPQPFVPNFQRQNAHPVNMEGERSTGFWQFHFTLYHQCLTSHSTGSSNTQHTSRIFFVGMAHHRGSLNHLLHEVIVLLYRLPRRLIIGG